MNCYAISVVADNVSDESIEECGHIIGCYFVRVTGKKKGKGLSCSPSYVMHQEIKNPNINIILVSEVPNTDNLKRLIGQKREVTNALEKEPKTKACSGGCHSVHLDFSETRCIHMTYSEFKEALT